MRRVGALAFAVFTMAVHAQVEIPDAPPGPPHTCSRYSGPRAPAKEPSEPLVRGDAAREIDQYVRKLGVSGAILVARGGETVLRSAYGLADEKCGVANTPATLFEAGSIAKAFTAVAVLQLAEDARLSLDDTLAKFFAAVPRDKRSITVRQLLTHTSGLASDHSEGDFDAMTRVEAIEAAFREPLVFPPGVQEKYSNTGYMLLAAIVEKATGRDWRRVVRERVIDKARLRDTFFFGERRASAARASFAYNEKGDMGSARDWPLTWAVMGGTGLLMTVEDLVTFMRAVEKGGLLAPGSMWMVHEPPVRFWTAGFQRSQADGVVVIGKGGSSHYGTRAAVAHIPSLDAYVAVLINKAPAGQASVHHDIVRYATQALAASR